MHLLLCLRGNLGRKVGEECRGSSPEARRHNTFKVQKVLTNNGKAITNRFAVARERARSDRA